MEKEKSFKKMAERWETYESRGSRTVLREPEGEVPLGYSPEGRGKQLVRIAMIRNHMVATSSEVYNKSIFESWTALSGESVTRPELLIFGLSFVFL